MPTPIHQPTIDQLPVRVYASNDAMGQAAAAEASGRDPGGHRPARRGQRDPGHGQLAAHLSAQPTRKSRISTGTASASSTWTSTSGLDPQHPASFPLFLRATSWTTWTWARSSPWLRQPRTRKPPAGPTKSLLRHHPADLCACGIGENGHLAFNDPPYADFDDPVWVKVVQLDERSRRQQVGEGHFADLAEVPTHAVTLTIPALLAATNRAVHRPRSAQGRGRPGQPARPHQRGLPRVDSAHASACTAVSGSGVWQDW